MTLRTKKAERDELEREANVKANLAGSDLWGANLTGSNLRDANLLGATLMYADLTNIKHWQEIKSVEHANIYMV